MSITRKKHRGTPKMEREVKDRDRARRKRIDAGNNWFLRVGIPEDTLVIAEIMKKVRGVPGVFGPSLVSGLCREDRLILRDAFARAHGNPGSAAHRKAWERFERLARLYHGAYPKKECTP